MKEKNNTIEFWRFLGCIGIIFLHFEGALLENDPSRWFRADYLWVDFYFMLSGFFLYLNFRQNRRKEPLRGAAQYTWGRIKRFAPIYYSSFVVIFIYQNYGLLSGGGQIKQILSNLYKSFWELLFLHSTGITWDFVNFVTWYISALLIIGLFVYSLLLWNEQAFLGIIAPFFVFLIYSYYSGGIDVHLHYARISWGAGNRAVAGICMGCLVAYFYDVIREKTVTKKQICVLSVLEIVVVLLITWELIGRQLESRNMRLMVLFPVLIFFSMWQKTFLSRALNHSVCGFLGKLSVGLYFYQTLIRDIWFCIHPVPAQAPIPVKEYLIYLVYVLIVGVLIYGAGLMGKRFFRKLILVSAKNK